MSKKLARLIKNNWGFALLTPFLATIIAATIQKELFLVGWDNFSVSLNTGLNFPRTLFSTWREYRGLGVPGDSEVTDIFRQLIYLALSPFVRPQLLYQLYIFAALLLGVLGVYLLGKNLISRFQKQTPHFLTETCAGLGALLYLFNLNTLSVFYMPMVMYVTRFAALPWIVFSFIRLLQSPKPRRSDWVLFILACLFGSTAYVTATVFITILFVLVVISTTGGKLFKSAKILGVFLLLNSFWLLAFFNYTSQKSSIIPHASTFLEVNEIQLNQNPQNFTWNRLLTFYPDFFDTKAQKISDGSETDLHPDSSVLESAGVKRTFLYLFPLLYLSGALLILFKFKNPYTRFIPLLLFAGLFMVRKEYSPFGFIYEGLSNNIALFNVIFRFGGSKFYALNAFSGSLSAAILFFFILKSISRFKPKLLSKTLALAGMFSLLLAGIYTFSGYFTGNFISPLVHNRIPQAYFELAEDINSDQEYFRVLHLPQELTSYWNNHTWGYVGSSFLTFMLDKPLLDRTFEPASLENDKVDQTVLALTQNSEKLDSQQLSRRALQFQNLLKHTKTKYIIFDESISEQVLSRGNSYWGNFSREGTTTLLKHSLDRGYISLEKSYPVQVPGGQPDNSLQLYKVNEYSPLVDSKTVVENISFAQDDLLASPFLSENTDLAQSWLIKGSILPFYIPSASHTSSSDSISINIKPDTAVNSLSLTQTSQQTAVNVMAKKDAYNLYIGFSSLDFPLADGFEQPEMELVIPLNKMANKTAQNSNNFLSDWHILPYQDLSAYRLALGQSILPLPAHVSSDYRHLATVMVEQNPFNITLLEPATSVPLDPSLFVPTQDPNCFQDKSTGYEYNFNTDKNLSISAKNGSACLTKPLALAENEKHLEIQFEYSLTSTNLPVIAAPTQSSFYNSVWSNLNSLPPAAYFRFCLLDLKTDGCLNNHEAIRQASQRTITVPGAKPADSSTQILISLLTLGENQSFLNIGNILLNSFKPLYSADITLSTNNSLFINTLQELNLKLPKTISPYSFYFNPKTDAFSVYNQPCEKTDEARFTKISDDQTIQYARGCENGSYVKLPFSGSNFYLWQTDYNLLSGKYPRFLLSSPDFIYKNEYLSLYQGYPEIEGFKKLQTSDAFWKKSFVADSGIQSTLANAQPFSSYTFIHPGLTDGDTKAKLFVISNHAQNHGIVSLFGMNIIHLPQSWSTLRLSPDEPAATHFASAQITQTKRILPSLWRIKLKPDSSGKPILLELGQGYDRQWKLYKTTSAVFAFLGIGDTKAVHLKVNGLTNGWIIEDAQGSKEATFYALYTPERLTLLGWMITLGTIALLLRQAVKHHRD